MRCPNCDAELPANAPSGICPKCLLQAGLAEPAAAENSDPFAATLHSDSAADHDDAEQVGPGGTIGYFGDYELLEEIARGGMGVVYKARQVNLNRIVALKMILSGQLASEQDVERFRGEAEAAASLQHPHIVAIHEIGEHDGQHYFSMDYVAGRSLAELAREHPLEPRQAAEYVTTIAKTVEYAHQQGIVHRDLKPANVLVDENDQPRITDFGLARRMEGDSALTATGQVLGTPSFMSPEQAAARHDEIGPASDLYSLGAILYDLLTGRPPFQAFSPVETLQQVIEREPVSPVLLNNNVPPDLATICLKCLQKQPARRYQSAAALAEDLQSYLHGEPIKAHPVGRRERMWRWCKRNPMVASLATGLILALLLGMVGITWQWRQAEHERQRTRRHLYAAHINLAQQAHEADNIGAMHDLLQRHVPQDGQEDLRGFEWQYLWQLSHQELKQFDLPAGYFYAMALSADGKMLATAQTGQEQVPVTHSYSVKNWPWQQPRTITRTTTQSHQAWQVKLWDVETSELKSMLSRRDVDCTGLAISPDGTTLAWISKDDTSDGGSRTHHRMRLWDTKAGETLAEFDLGRRTQIDSAAFSADGRMLAYNSGGEIFLNDVETLAGDASAKPFSLTPDDDTWQKLAFSRHGNVLAAADSSSLKLWEIQRTADAFVAEERLHIHPGSFTYFALSPDANQLALGRFRGQENMVQLWDIGENKLLHTLRTRHPVGLMHNTHTLAYSHDGRLLAAVNGSVVTLWSATTGEELATYKGHVGRTNAVAFLPDGKRLVSASHGQAKRPGSLRVWQLPSQRKPDLIQNTHTIYDLAFAPDGRTLVAVSGEWEAARVFEVATGKVVREIRGTVHKPGRHDRFFTTAWSPDGKLLALGGNTWELDTDGSGWQSRPHAWVYDKDGKRVNSFKIDADRSSPYGIARKGLVFLADSKTLLVAAGTKFRRCDVYAGKQRLFPDNGPALGGAGSNVIQGMRLSADGRRLAAAHSNFVALWDVRSGTEYAAFQPQPYVGGYTHTAISPDGRLMAVAHGDNTVLIYDADGLAQWWSDPDDALKFRLAGHAARVTALSFMPDSQTLVTAGLDRMIKIWDMVTGEERLTLSGHTTEIWSLDISTDGRTLISGDRGGTIKLWRVASEAEVDARK